MSPRPAGCGGSPVRRARPPSGAIPARHRRLAVALPHAGLRDVATLYVGQYPSTRVFEGKTLTLGGHLFEERRNRRRRPVGAAGRANFFWSGWFRTPRRETALLADFDEKVERICRECASERVTAFAGVPSWNLALLRRMVEYTGRRNLVRVCRIWNCSLTEAGVRTPTVRRSAN